MRDCSWNARNKLIFIFIHSLAACQKQRATFKVAPWWKEWRRLLQLIASKTERWKEKPCQRGAHTCRKNKIIDGAKVRASLMMTSSVAAPTQALIQRRSNWLKERLTRAACFAPEKEHITPAPRRAKHPPLGDGADFLLIRPHFWNL